MQRVRSLAPVLVGALLSTAAIFSLLQPAARGRDHDGAPQRWWKPPADVRAMLRDVSAQRMEGYDRALVSFGTRHTLSSQDDPARGNVTEATIENLNKDDNQVGVRAIDRDGNRSPVAYPIPAS